MTRLGLNAQQHHYTKRPSKEASRKIMQRRKAFQKCHPACLFGRLFYAHDMTYADKLKDPRWQKMRLKVMEYAAFRCQICGDGKSTLHVHHSYYTRGKDPWQYPMGSLICVCEYHHSCIHGTHKPEAVATHSPVEPAHPATSNDTPLPQVAAARFDAIFAMLDKIK